MNDLKCFYFFASFSARQRRKLKTRDTRHEIQVNRSRDEMRMARNARLPLIERFICAHATPFHV